MRLHRKENIKFSEDTKLKSNLRLLKLLSKAETILLEADIMDYPNDKRDYTNSQQELQQLISMLDNRKINLQELNSFLDDSKNHSQAFNDFAEDIQSKSDLQLFSTYKRNMINLADTYKISTPEF